MSLKEKHNLCLPTHLATLPLTPFRRAWPREFDW